MGQLIVAEFLRRIINIKERENKTMECGDKVNAKVNEIIEDVKGLRDPENWTW